MKICYQFRCYPTKKQQQALSRIFGACRYVYNWGLQFRSDTYNKGRSINYNQSSAALTELKHQPETLWLNEISSVALQQSLRHLQTAFKNFFDHRSKYPKFKKRRNKQSAEYTKSAFKWNKKEKSLALSGIGRLKVRWSRSFQSEPSTVTITKHCDGRYFVILVLDEPIEQWPKTRQEVGIDLGINQLATLSTGEYINNPRLLAQKTKQLARAQRVLSRREKGSGRWHRQRLKVARLHSWIVNSRMDYLHKVTTDLVRRFDLICIEDLNIQGMMADHKLARAIGDAALSQFGTFLEYKCDWRGKKLVKIDRFYPSSKRCHVCGHIVKQLSLSVRKWDCPKCGAHHDRDDNASQNILAEGHSVIARGGLKISELIIDPDKGYRSVNQSGLDTENLLFFDDRGCQ